MKSRYKAEMKNAFVGWRYERITAIINKDNEKMS